MKKTTNHKPAILIGILLMHIACNNKAPLNTVMDVDGHVYRTIKIGNQLWMAENLQVTHYRNGDPINYLPGAEEWSTTTSGACCSYSNDSGAIVTFGRLYNWHAVKDKRGLAPPGWRLPAEKEIKELVNYLGGDTVAAAKMKIAGPEHWLSLHAHATNESGFTAMAGGYRFGKGSFHTGGSNGYWWTAERSFELYAWTSRLYMGFADVQRDSRYENYGLSVRCIKE